MNPVDVYDDHNLQAFYAIDKLVGLPEFVKNAHVGDHDTVKALPAETFCDMSRRKFPCHTKQATFLSNAYFQQSRNTYPKADADLIQGRLNKFAHFWNIGTIVENFNKSWTKVSSFNSDDGSLQDSDYALVMEHEGKKIRRFPMPNMLSVKMAAEALFANRFMYTYPMRKAAAIRILLKADEADKAALKKQAFIFNPAIRISNETQDYLQRAAGVGMVHPFKAAEKVAHRWLMIKDTHPLIAEKVAELNQTLRQIDAADVTCDLLGKCACFIDIVDRETGIARYYADGMDMPEDIFFEMIQKEAQSILDQNVMLTTGNAYPLGIFTTMPLEKIAAVLGNDFIASVSGLDGTVDPELFAQVLPTLPRGDAALLERAMSEGIKEAGNRNRGASHYNVSKRALQEKLVEEGHQEAEPMQWNLAYKVKL